MKDIASHVIICFAAFAAAVALAAERELQQGTMSATFVAKWLTKLTRTANRDAPTVTAKCGDGGTIDLVGTGSGGDDSDVTCEKMASEQELRCTSGDSVFSTQDMLNHLENGVSVTFSCTGPSDEALLARAEIDEQSFTVDVGGKFSGINTNLGTSEAQLKLWQVCDDKNVKSRYCAPEGDMFGYCEDSDFGTSCRATCEGLGCFDTCSFTRPKVSSWIDALSCKSTSYPQIICDASSTSPTTKFEAEDATNIVNTNLPASETCCRSTDDARWKAWKPGYVLVDQSTGGGAYVGFFDEGDYLAFGPIDFGSGGCANIELRYSRGDKAQIDWDEVIPTKELAKVLFFLDSPTGPFAGEFSVQQTGGWDSYEAGVASISAYGEHTLYLVGQDDRSVMRLDWIQVSPGANPNAATDTSPTEGVTDTAVRPPDDLTGSPAAQVDRSSSSSAQRNAVSLLCAVVSYVFMVVASSP
mmetsp:Transcript_5047/g.10688  ORF Transcript_5047/g.10688 Transcript_5047/m.10688 type:complete len:470 (-) Transcript_5047:1982-3391(-)